MLHDRPFLNGTSPCILSYPAADDSHVSAQGAQEYKGEAETLMPVAMDGLVDKELPTSPRVKLL